ncbi:hypothetical protein R3Q06_34655 [Rhodococcus erythropolis]|uniref:DUF4352 domain-containing protein n=1 Tax=Rhodococcus erythropolis TaxID=1833 RepID=UPI002949784B|nr:hypothetical protein [Rhodococcus erythropolis]MDV6278543.1 hypothetical protein [Rhodococcus erythropolis]
MRGTATVVAAALAIVTLVGCGSTVVGPTAVNDSAMPSQTTTVASRDAAAAQPDDLHIPVDERADSGGAAITVFSVDTVPEIPVQKSSEPDFYARKVAAEGYRYVVVSAAVENVGALSIDLSCGHVIVNALTDTNGRTFTTIDSLERVQGNRGCADNLKPGATAEMHYVYEIPDNAVPTRFEFYDAVTSPLAPKITHIDF